MREWKNRKQSFQGSESLRSQTCNQFVWLCWLRHGQLVLRLSGNEVIKRNVKAPKNGKERENETGAKVIL